MHNHLKILSKKHYPIAIFLLLAMLIMAPLYKSGFVFLVDMVWGPGTDFSDIIRDGIGSSFPVRMVLYFFSFLFSVEVLQKIVLTGVLFLPGVAMYRLALRYMPQSLAVGAGMLYALNPYVYDRFIIGHWIVLLGYGFFPISVLLLNHYFETRTWRNFLVFALAFSLYPIISLHWVYIASGFLFVYGILEIKTYKVHQVRELIDLREFFKKFLVFLVMFFVINSFWLIGFFDAGKTFSAITLNDFRAFSTIGDPEFGIWFNVLSLYGFWSSSFLQFKDFFSWWWVIALVVMMFSIFGAYLQIRRGNTLALAIAIIFIPALFLSVGYGSSFTEPVIDFLFKFVPFFRGLRDTEKISGLIAFAYAFFTPLGVSSTLLYLGKKASAKKEKSWRWLAPSLVALIPFLWSGTMLFGAYGQVAPYSYPNGWYEAEEVLSADSETQKVLFLPWHMYIRLNFAGGEIVGNPATAFFSKEMITGLDFDNLLMLSSQKNVYDEHVAELTLETIPDERAFWISKGVTDIAIAKTDDWEQFSGLWNSHYFENIFDSDSIALFKIKK